MGIWDKGEVATSDKVASERPHLGGDIRFKDLKEEGSRPCAYTRESSLCKRRSSEKTCAGTLPCQAYLKKSKAVNGNKAESGRDESREVRWDQITPL